MTEPRVVCVLGMHRAGTSAIARVLNLLGVDLGPADQLMPAVPSNPRGHWEQWAIVRLNEEILERFGGSWNRPPVLPDGWEAAPILEDMRFRARALVKSTFGDAPLWGWKDPRTCLTLPFWRRLLPPMRYVICLRNVVDVAHSLETRDGMTLEEAARLWRTYTSAALAHTAGHARLVIFYEDLMADWGRQARRLAEFLEVPERLEQPEVLSRIEAEVDPTLRHHSTSLAEVLEDPKLPVDAKALYAALWTGRNEATGDVGDLADTQSPVGSREWQQWFSGVALPSIGTSLKRVDRLEGQLGDAEQRVQRLESQLAEIRKSRAWWALSRYRTMVSRLAPVHSRRWRLYTAATFRKALPDLAATPAATPPAPSNRYDALVGQIAWRRRRRQLRRSRPSVGGPDVSIVVVAYNMGRELPRTLRSLSREMQIGLEQITYEIIVVDNGSNPPVPPSSDPSVSVIRLDEAPPSPCHAINVGLRACRGDLIGVMIDGARLASPGLVHHALVASRLHSRPMISTLSFHLGPDRQERSVLEGYGRETEDALLASSGWEKDGYRLFSISTLAASSKDGWFRPIFESNALFLPRSMWAELGGYEERFVSPGGGLANLDLFERAWSLPGVQHIVLLGEGTFHQFHGGVASNSPDPPFDRWWAEYRAIRGRDLRGINTMPLYVGRVHWPVLQGLGDAVRTALGPPSS